MALAPVAIIGMSCRLPGSVNDIESFRRLLLEGRDAIAEIPPDRMDVAHYYDPAPATPGRMITRFGGFVDHIHDFDAAFFAISPREAARLDPQQRLLLETVWEALEDAGLDAKRLEGSRTGVFVGQWTSDFEGRLFRDPAGVDFQMTLGSGRYGSSGRISYFLGLQGPSLTIDTACSSSLAAVHLAARAIQSAEADMAFAGGVNLILQPHINIAYSQSRMMAVDGRCKFGDASGDGYVRSEGVGMVLLKPLDRALADGDRIHAVIRGSAINNDGRSSGLMGRPSQPAQEELLRSAYRDAGVSPADIGYVEAHGTGTRAGDPVELGAIGKVFGESRVANQRVWVGSVKTNIGHTEGAAGIVGLIKTALTVESGCIPPSLHLKTPNPNIDWGSTSIPAETTAWPAIPGPRRASVNAFGIAGANAHVVLEQAPPAEPPDAPSSRKSCLLPLSAKSPEALRALAGRYADLLSQPAAPSLQAVAWSAALRRTALAHRAAFVAADGASLIQSLRDFAAGGPATAEGHAGAAVPRTAFVVPGQGGQWVGMARGLLAREPVFAAAMRACDEAARPWLEVSLLDQLALSPDDPSFRLSRIEVIQPALVAIAIAYARWLDSLGIQPQAVLGHSMGEVGAAFLAGALDLASAMRIICRRSALMGRTSGRGAMAMVELPMQDAEQRIVTRQGLLAVAVANSPRSCVVSGDPVALESLLVELESDGVFCRRVKVDVASHSPQMDEPARDLVAELVDLPSRPATVPILSTVLARRISGEELDAAYWGSNLRRPVRFGDCIDQLVADDCHCFVELGPHPILTAAIAQTAQSRGANVVTIASGHRDEPEGQAGLTLVAALWAAGHAVAWERVLSPAAPIDLPLYPWQRERHWTPEAAVEAGTARNTVPSAIPKEQQAWLHALRWVPARSSAARPPTVSGDWLLASSRPEEARPLIDALTAAGCEAAWVAFEDLESGLQRVETKTPLRGLVVLASERADASYGPVAAIRALVERTGAISGTPQPKLWWVTVGAQAVAERPRSNPAIRSAAAWGAGRVIAEEHPGNWGGMVDLDPAETAARNAELLVDELLGSDRESQVAYRDGQRFVLRLEALEAGPAEPQPFRWRVDASYLITGGLGELGLSVAREMVSQGARRLVLMGRSALPPRQRWTDPELDAGTAARVAAVWSLEAAGASVHLLTADASDAAQLEIALRNYAAEGWPPIRGVIHAAGVNEDRLALQTGRDSFDRVVGPKLEGALTLDRLLADLDCFVMFSSMCAFFGIPGTASYAAANAGLDALAQARRTRGQSALSIQWGPWHGAGMLAGQGGRANSEAFERLGVRGFSKEQGVAMFRALAGRPDAGCAVVPIDWKALAENRRGRNLTLFSGRIPGDTDSTGTPSSMDQRLVGLAVPERRKLLEPVVRDALSRVLKLAAPRIDPRMPFGNMGLTSLLAMELRNALEATLGRPMSATLAWNYPTVEALVRFLAGEPESREQPATDAAPIPPLDESVVELSDAQAAQLLRRRR